MSKSLRTLILEKKGRHLLGILLVICGILLILSSFFVAVLYSNIGFGQKDFATIFLEDRFYKLVQFGTVLAYVFGLRLIYYSIIGSIILVTGIILVTQKRKVISLIEEVIVKLNCSSCNHDWHDSRM